MDMFCVCMCLVHWSSKAIKVMNIVCSFRLNGKINATQTNHIETLCKSWTKLAQKKKCRSHNRSHKMQKAIKKTSNNQASNNDPPNERNKNKLILYFTTVSVLVSLTRCNWAHCFASMEHLSRFWIMRIGLITLLARFPHCFDT